MWGWWGLYWLVLSPRFAECCSVHTGVVPGPGVLEKKRETKGGLTEEGRGRVILLRRNGHGFQLGCYTYSLRTYTHAHSHTQMFLTIQNKTKGPFSDLQFPNPLLLPFTNNFCRNRPSSPRKSLTSTLPVPPTPIWTEKQQEVSGRPVKEGPPFPALLLYLFSVCPLSLFCLFSYVC